jgi:hypothetical protein
MVDGSRHIEWLLGRIKSFKDHFVDAEPFDNTWSLPRPKEAPLMNGLVFPVK